MKKIKVVITGPESTGKTSLCSFLAKEFNTLCLYEYAREYVENLDREYNYKDLEVIAEKILELEKEYENKAEEIFFVDTSVIIMEVWFEIVYKKVPLWFSNEMKKYFADLYLLMKPDIDWQPDPVRENPGEMRTKLFEIYKTKLENYNLKYAVISGIADDRFLKAKKIVQNFLSKKTTRIF